MNKKKWIAGDEYLIATTDLLGDLFSKRQNIMLQAEKEGRSALKAWQDGTTAEQYFNEVLVLRTDKVRKIHQLFVEMAAAEQKTWDRFATGRNVVFANMRRR